MFPDDPPMFSPLCMRVRSLLQDKNRKGNTSRLTKPPRMPLRGGFRFDRKQAAPGIPGQPVGP
jgi:hypothetical protein